MRRFVRAALRGPLGLWVGRRFGSFAVAPTARIDLLRIHGGAGASLRVGPHSIVEATLTFERAGATIEIGERTFIGRSHLVALSRIAIGDDVLVSWGVTITDHNSHSVRFSERAADVLDWGRGAKDWSNVPHADVRIGSKAWIGFNAVLLRGVTVGEGAVVGAASVVTKDVAPWTIVAGNPARLIREIPDDGR